MNHRIAFIILITLLTLMAILVACQEPAGETEVETPAVTEESSQEARPVMGPGSGMMARHHATIPEAYAGLSNPNANDETSLARGEEIYIAQCATCHGEEGHGDGPAGAELDPAPAPLAHTGRMLSDAYLFWRISEGGAEAPFNSAMPAWKATYQESERWDVVNYLRLLAGGRPAASEFDPQAEAEQRAQMLAKAQEQGLITEEEAALFDDVHAKMDAIIASSSGQRRGMMGGMMGSGQGDLMSELIASGEISESDAQAFNDIHDRLLMAGLMQ